MGDPGPGLARQATEIVLSQFYTRSYDDVMSQPTAQQEVLAGGLQPIPPAPIPAPPGHTGPPGTDWQDGQDVGTGRCGFGRLRRSSQDKPDEGGGSAGPSDGGGAGSTSKRSSGRA